MKQVFIKLSIVPLVIIVYILFAAIFFPSNKKEVCAKHAATLISEDEAAIKLGLDFWEIENNSDMKAYEKRNAISSRVKIFCEYYKN